MLMDACPCARHGIKQSMATTPQPDWAREIQASNFSAHTGARERRVRCSHVLTTRKPIVTLAPAPTLTLAHLTLLTQGAVTPFGGSPLRLTETTASPVRSASSLMRLPTKPLPPKTIHFGCGLAPLPLACHGNEIRRIRLPCCRAVMLMMHGS